MSADVDAELELMRLRSRLYDLLDELDIIGEPRAAMIDDPERAVPILESARRARGVRSVAAIAIARFRRPEPPAPEPEPELVDAPPGLADLEQVWSLGEFTQATMLPLMAAAITRHGGFAAIKPRT